MPSTPSAIDESKRSGGNCRRVGWAKTSWPFRGGIVDPRSSPPPPPPPNRIPLGRGCFGFIVPINWVNVTSSSRVAIGKGSDSVNLLKGKSPSLHHLPLNHSFSCSLEQHDCQCACIEEEEALRFMRAIRPKTLPHDRIPGWTITGVKGTLDMPRNVPQCLLRRDGLLGQGNGITLHLLRHVNVLDGDQDFTRLGGSKGTVGTLGLDRDDSRIGREILVLEQNECHQTLTCTSIMMNRQIGEMIYWPQGGNVSKRLGDN